jgi:hypothetical protein
VKSMKDELHPTRRYESSSTTFATPPTERLLGFVRDHSIRNLPFRRISSKEQISLSMPPSAHSLSVDGVMFGGSSTC